MKEFKGSTVDLIEEVEQIAAGEYVRHTTMVVTYSDRTEKVPFEGPEKALKALNAHVEAGGLPVGIIVFETEGHRARLRPRLLAEHAGNESLEKFLLTFVGRIIAGLLATGEVQFEKSNSAWPLRLSDDTEPTRTNNTHQERTNRMEATATFVVKDWDEDRHEHDDGTKFGHAEVKQSFQGDVEGEGTADFMIMYEDDESRAVFVGTQRIVGHVRGREGSFLLQLMGTYERETGMTEAKGAVIPDATTGELRGLKGEGGFTASHRVAGSVWLKYDFEALDSQRNQRETVQQEHDGSELEA